MTETWTTALIPVIEKVDPILAIVLYRGQASMLAAMPAISAGT